MNREMLEAAKAFLAELQSRGVREGRGDLDDPNRGNRLWLSVWGYDDECGTCACIAGWLTTAPALRARGLRRLKDVSDDVCLSNAYAPAFAGAEGYSAMAEFFGISLQQSEHLFSSSNPSSFRHALVRFDQVLAGSDDWDDFMTTRRQRREWEQETEFAHV